ncbi:hypothetical protein U1Q18_048762, partial [Sarracenia purpurea var. burkii]
PWKFNIFNCCLKLTGAGFTFCLRETLTHQWCLNPPSPTATQGRRPMLPTPRPTTVDRHPTTTTTIVAIQIHHNAECRRNPSPSSSHVQPAPPLFTSIGNILHLRRQHNHRLR